MMGVSSFRCIVISINFDLLCERKTIVRMVRRVYNSRVQAVQKFQSRQLAEHSHCAGTALFADAVMRPFALLGALHNAGFNENFHMIGKCRLRNAQLFNQNAGAFFTAAQHFQYA